MRLHLIPHLGSAAREVLGPTDPKDAPSASLRGQILADWKKLEAQKADLESTVSSLKV